MKRQVHGLIIEILWICNSEASLLQSSDMPNSNHFVVHYGDLLENDVLHIAAVW